MRGGFCQRLKRPGLARNEALGVSLSEEAGPGTGMRRWVCQCGKEAIHGKVFSWALWL